MAYLSPLLRVSPSCNPGVGRGTFFSGAQDILQLVVARIQFLVVVGLRSLFS